MIKKSVTHLVFKTNDKTETSKFWEAVFQVDNRSKEDDFLSYDINGFIINFKCTSSNLHDQKEGIGHLGIELQSVIEVDQEFQRLSSILSETIKTPFGGAGKGPYRFYLKDPNGITIEFESWEGCSD